MQPTNVISSCKDQRSKAPIADAFVRQRFVIPAIRDLIITVLSSVFFFLKKRTSKKNVDGRSTSSHDNKEFRNRSMEKQRNGVSFPEDGDSCYKTGWIDSIILLWWGGGNIYKTENEFSTL